MDEQTNNMNTQPEVPIAPVASADAPVMATSVPTPVQAAPTQPAQQMLCPTCHFPITPAEYFCPNCGTKLRVPPLSKSLTSQLLLYGFSLVLPVIAYLAITKWQGITYIRSSDPDTRRIGFIALGLLVISSIFTFWYAAVQFQGIINSVTGSIGGGASGLCDPTSGLGC